MSHVHRQTSNARHQSSHIHQMSHVHHQMSYLHHHCIVHLTQETPGILVQVTVSFYLVFQDRSENALHLPPPQNCLFTHHINYFGKYSAMIPLPHEDIWYGCPQLQHGSVVLATALQHHSFIGRKRVTWTSYATMEAQTKTTALLNRNVCSHIQRILMLTQSVQSG